MEFEVLGWPPDGPALDLDHERFAYAGKFVVTDTGKAVVRDGGDLVGAAAFSPDRTDERTLRCRYITIRRDRHGEGVGPRLLRFVADRAQEHGFADVLIAVNNPRAYIAAYRAGFAYTGEETGLAEVVLGDGRPRVEDHYRAGLRAVGSRELPSDLEVFVERKLASGIPDPVESN